MSRAMSLVAGLLLCTFGAALPLGAQTYPERSIRVIVPFVAGGGLDTFTRVVSAKMSESLGHQVIVENRLGAQGNIGMSLGAKAPPDGYTLTAAFNGPMVINPFMFADPGFDPIKDFAPIALGTVQPEVLVASPKAPATVLADLVVHARANPGKLTFGSASSTAHLAVDLFKQVAKVDVVHVQHKAATQAAIDLAGGFLDYAVMSVAAATPFHSSGKARIIAVLGPDRVPSLPDVPTSAEAGLPDFQMAQWYGFLAPSGTPTEVIRILNGALNQALDAPDVKSRLLSAGLTPRGGSAEEFDELIRTDIERFSKVMKSAGVKPVQ